MMERDQIIKALECCTKGGCCDACQYDVCASRCVQNLLLAALALIRELTEENDLLKEQNAYFVKEAVFSPMERANNTIAVKAEIVREMQNMLKERAYTNNYCQGIVLKEDIDKVAEELLKGE